MAAMAGSIWTTEYFDCPNCGLSYAATKEQHSTRHSGRFVCEVCAVEVHAWSGNHDFFNWKIDQPVLPVFGKRWA
jgi:transcription elongation factor Elf1